MEPKRLCAAHGKGTVTALLAAYRHMSPAIGLASLHDNGKVSKLLGLRHSWDTVRPDSALGHACLLSEELFYAVGSTVRICTNLSNAAAHLDMHQLGTIAGLAIRGVGDRDLDRGLRRCGVLTNRVSGHWTGVSMARHVRFAGLVRSAAGSLVGKHVALPVFLRYIWERAETKQCLLQFLDAVHAQAPILDPSMTPGCENEETRQAFLNSSFSAADVSATGARAAALAILAAAECSTPIPPEPLEVLAVAVSRALVFKPALRLRRHFYGGPRDVPDCVEVVVREIVDLLLFDPDAQRMDLQLLPPGCSPALMEYYALRTDPAASACQSDSAAWFALCAGLEGCEYLSASHDGRPFELRPSLRNVARALGQLLQPGKACWSRLEDLASFWNEGASRGQRQRILLVAERIELSRGLASEEAIRRERATLRLQTGSRHSLDVILDPANNTATASHRWEDGGSWMDDALTSAHSAAWIGAASSAAPVEPVLAAALWPALLGDAMLRALPASLTPEVSLPECAIASRLQAILHSRWSDADRDACAPLHGEAATADVTSADERKSRERRGDLLVRAVGVGASLPSSHVLLPWLLSTSHTAQADPSLLAESMMHWEATAGTHVADDALWPPQAVTASLLSRPEGDLVSAMMRLGSAAKPRAAWRGARALRLCQAVPDALRMLNGPKATLSARSLLALLRYAARIVHRA
jgi:hypothetical protein